MADDDFVPIRGVVHLHTDLGVFLEIQGRRVFIPGDLMERPPRRFVPGETVTLWVHRSYAKQEGLVA